MAIHIDVLTRLEDRKTRADAERLKNDFTRLGDEAGAGFSVAYAKGVERSSPRVTKAYEKYARSLDKVSDAQAKARQEAVRHNEVLKTSAADTEKVVRSSERLAKARRDEAAAMRSARSSHLDYSRSLRDLGDSAGGVEGALRSLGTTIGSLGRIAGPAAVLGIGKVLYDATGAAIQASKALLLLPAAATAAGAAIGTLNLATSGFADTVSDLASGDLKAFAEDIQRLSPNAQQAALSIQKIFPQLENLRKATQDSLFAGLGAQIERLSTEYLPSIQDLTTSIADSFNQMITGIADELMTPQTRVQLQSLFDNIGATFRELAPAARDFARAFVDIAAAGSGFLPELARSASELARQFAGFIRDARQSGQLRQWIQEGIDAVRILGGALWDLSRTILDVFGSDGRQRVQDFKTDINDVRVIIAELSGDTKAWSDDWNEELTKMTGPAAALRDAILDIPEAFATVVNKIADMLNGVKHGMEWMIRNARTWLDAVTPGYTPPPFEPLPDIPHVPVGDWGPYRPPPGPTGQRRPGFYRDRYGYERPIPQSTGAPGSPWAGPYSVPSPPPDTGAGTPTTGYAAPGPMGTQPYMNEIAALAARFGLTPISGKRNEPGSYHDIGEALDVASPDPASMMAFANYMAAEFGSQLRELIYGAPGFTGLIGDGANVTGTGYYSAKTLAEHAGANAHVHVAMDHALTSATDLSNGVSHLGDVMGDASTAVSTYTASQQQLGAQLDQDFGISKGLPGIAENITKFLANLAFAPALGALSAVTDVYGTAGPGSGLLGMLAPRQNAAGTQMPNVFGMYTAEQVAAIVASAQQGGQPGQPGTAGPGNAPADPRSIAQQQMAAYGWGPGEWPALNQLWQEESKWDPTATNPKSGAFGIAQFLGHENDIYGQLGGYSADPRYQINAGLRYIADTYGSPSAAWTHWLANNSYDDGGTVPGYGHDPLLILAHPGETVIPTRVGQNPLDIFAPTAPPPGPPPGPFAPLPGQPTPPGEHQTYVPGQPLPDHPLPLEPGGVLNPGGTPHAPAPLPPRTVEELPTTPAGRYPGQGLNLPHGQGISPGGGIIGIAEQAAVSAAAAGAGVASFGAGGAVAAAFAQIAIDEINRAIQYGGQVAGIAVGGLMETFLPNESPLADIGGSWLGRIAGAAAGASAGTANLAGAIGAMLQGKPEDQKPPPGDQAPKGTPASGVGLGPLPGPVNSNNQTVNITAANANPNEIANVATHHLGAMYSGPGR